MRQVSVSQSNVAHVNPPEVSDVKLPIPCISARWLQMACPCRNSNVTRPSAGNNPNGKGTVSQQSSGSSPPRPTVGRDGTYPSRSNNGQRTRP